MYILLGVQFDPWLTIHGDDCSKSVQVFIFTGMKWFITYIKIYTLTHTKSRCNA